MSSGMPRVTTDDCIFLLGRPPVAELIGFVRSMAVDGHAVDFNSLVSEWRNAHQLLATIEAAESGIADNAPLAVLPAEIQPLADRVTADPVFKEAYGRLPTQLAVVDLDRLVVFQKFINLGFVQVLKESVFDNPSSVDIARIAFSLDRPQPPVNMAQAGANVFQFISPSSDLRPLESGLIRPDQVSGFKLTGKALGYVVMAIGFGSNYLSALQIEGRLILNNGSHRAYALRSLGITQVPCVIQQLSHRDELELVAEQEVRANPDRYLKAVRPPMLKDYFHAQLVKAFPVPRKNRIVQAQVASGISDVPST